MNKPRVLLIQDVLYPYRVPILERVAREVYLEVACVEKGRGVGATTFPVTVLKTKSFGDIRMMPGLRACCNGFDFVILQPHVSRPSVCTLPFWRNRK